MAPSPDPDRARKHRDRITRRNCKPRCLALVETYYPPHLREKILACCKRQLQSTYARACRHPLCPACCPIESHKIALEQYARFESCTPARRTGPRLAHEVYTLPPHLRHLVADRDGYAAWRAAVLATIRDVHGAAVAGVMNLHPIGDENLTTFHPHFDVVVNGYLLTDAGRIREHRPRYIHYDDARAIYKRRLVEHLGLEGDDVPVAVSIFLDRKRATFHTSRRKTWHIVRYSARHVYQPQFAWLQDNGTRGDWWYKPHKGQSRPDVYEGRDVIASLMAVDSALHGKKRRIWFGYMQNRRTRESARLFQNATPPPETSDDPGEEWTS